MVAVTLEHVTGDLFDLALPALAHGCNCSGSMAGSIAVETCRSSACSWTTW